MKRNDIIRIFFVVVFLLFVIEKSEIPKTTTDFSVWNVVYCLSNNEPATLKEMLSKNLQDVEDIDDKIKKICQFVSGLPLKHEITSKSRHLYEYDMSGNLIKDTVEFKVRFRTRANLTYKMTLKWCQYCPQDTEEEGISYISVRYLGEKENYIKENIITKVIIK